MTSRRDAGRNPRDSEFDRDDHGVDDDVEAARPCPVNQGQLGVVGEVRLGDQRGIRVNQCVPRAGGDLCCVERMCPWIVGPTLSCDDIRVHEHGSGELRAERVLNKRRLPGPVAADDEVEATARASRAPCQDRGMELVTELAAIVGAEHVLTDPATTASYTHDWTSRFSGDAFAVVRPGDADQVAAVMAACQRAERPMHPQGGNTSLVGGGVPAGSAAADRAPVVISMTRLDWIGEVDTRGGLLTAGAGATLAAVQRAARDAGWMYGVDIAARESATIGGTVATNAGGIRVCAFGMTRHQIAGVEAVLADGTVISHLAGLPKDNTGYDLAGLLTGSEGTLAVITAVALRLHRPPGGSTLVLLGVDDIATAQDVIATAVPAGGRLLAAEVMDRLGVQIVCEFAGLPWPLRGRDWSQLLLLEVEGDEVVLPSDVDAVVASDATDYARLWRYREHQSEAAAIMAARIGGVVHKLDVSVPLPRLAAFVGAMRPVLAGLPSVQEFYLFGHIADGNLHLEIAEPDAIDDSATAAVLGLVAEFGGSISAEHGIGQAKVRYLGLTRSEAELAAMRSIKTALDPAGLLAPGVIFSR